MKEFRAIGVSEHVAQAHGQQEFHYRRAFETAFDGILVLDAGEGLIVDLNDRAGEILGYAPAELLGRALCDVPGFQNSGLGTRILDAVKQSSQCRIEEWLLAQNRHGRYCDFSCSRFEEGAALRVQVSIRDITERIRRETALRDSEERYRMLVEGATDYAIFMMDGQGKVVSWNPGAERILQYSKGEILGRDAYLLFTPEDRARGEAAREMNVARREGRAEDERWHVRKDGTRFFASGVLTALRRPNGELCGFAKVMRDITERKISERAAQEAQKLESIGLLAGGVAHDFNNLLTGIIGGASLAAEDLPPGSQARRLMDDVVAAGQRAAHLTSQLLDYAGKGRFTVSIFDISQSVSEVPRLLHASLPATVCLELHLAGGLPLIEADPRQVQQIAMNLVINAVEAVGGKGLIGVSTGSATLEKEWLCDEGLGHMSPGEYVYLEVHDDGPGMDETTKARIFDPFFTTKFTGRGLGLAAVSGIVRGHRGGIQLSTAPGQGSTFRVYLPAVARPAESAPAVRKSAGSSAPLILVVEDDAMVRRVTETTLQRHGYRVILAENGREALDRIRSMPDRLAMVLLDLEMPVMSGEEAFREIRSMRPDLPVLVASGYSESIASRLLGNQVMKYFIQKPYTADSLGERVRQIAGVPPQVSLQ